MRILILSFYFPPDLGPGAIRGFSITESIVEASCVNRVEVFTTTPNRYHSSADFSVSPSLTRGVTVTRIPLPIALTSFLKQALGFVWYALCTYKATRKQKWDIVVATSSRSMTSVLGALIAGRTGAKFYFDVRDLFSEAVNQVFASSSALIFLRPFSSWAEQYSLQRASRINVISPAFIPIVRDRIDPSKKISAFTHGIDISFIRHDFFGRDKNILEKDRPTVVYAGNIGKGQALETILPTAAKILEAEIDFLVIGDGSAKDDLVLELKRLNVRNVRLEPPMSRDSLMAYYAQADILFLHLADYECFRYVIPSKIFEYAATGKPIIAGVSGFSLEFIESKIVGASVFSSGDSLSMVAAVKTQLSGDLCFNRDAFTHEFARSEIMKKMAADILALNHEV